MKVTPLDLTGIYEAQDLPVKSRFSWRWFERGGNEYRFVTIEDTGNDESHRGFGVVRPCDLVGLDEFYTTETQNIENTKFNWRWLQRGETRYRVVTIEDCDVVHAGTRTISPSDFSGVGGYSDDIEGKKFNWRWFTRGEDEYRVLTVEA